MSEKAAQPDAEAMIAQIAEWLLAGMRRSAVPAYAKEEGWTVARAELLNLITAAEDQIVADAQSELPGATLAEALAIGQLRDTYATACRGGDVAGALAARKELNRLSGLTAKTKPEAPLRPAALPMLDQTQAQLIRLLEVKTMPHRGELIATQDTTAAEAGDTADATAGPAGAVPPDTQRGRRRKVSGRKAGD